jgi:uncharacterized protein YjcR
MGNHHPIEKHWSEDEQLAYWIDAYNAFTIKLIIFQSMVKRRNGQACIFTQARLTMKENPFL